MYVDVLMVSGWKNRIIGCCTHCMVAVHSPGCNASSLISFSYFVYISKTSVDPCTSASYYYTPLVSFSFSRLYHLLLPLTSWTSVKILNVCWHLELMLTSWTYVDILNLCWHLERCTILDIFNVWYTEVLLASYRAYSFWFLELLRLPWTIVNTLNLCWHLELMLTCWTYVDILNLLCWHIKRCTILDILNLDTLVFCWHLKLLLISWTFAFNLNCC